MGNGAITGNIVPVATGGFSQKEFATIEKLCNNSYFYDNFQDYQSALQKAIRNDSIDVLEILIPAGNAKRLQPLHMACRLGKLDSVELLLSAGFSASFKDDHGRTPLHLCGYVCTNESGLCATLLATHEKKATRIMDRDGLTPLHVAAKENNCHVSLESSYFMLISFRCV